MMGWCDVVAAAAGGDDDDVVVIVDYLAVCFYFCVISFYFTF